MTFSSREWMESFLDSIKVFRRAISSFAKVICSFANSSSRLNALLSFSVLMSFVLFAISSSFKDKSSKWFSFLVIESEISREELSSSSISRFRVFSSSSMALNSFFTSLMRGSKESISLSRFAISTNWLKCLFINSSKD